MLSINKIKKSPRIMGGGVIFFKNNSSPITSFGDRSIINTSKYKINNKFSAFSLIELSIVLIIMGLLVAGITGGASLIDNTRLTSLRREIDDHIKDVFTFYARVGRLPGDIDNSGKFGFFSLRNPYVTNDFSSPYNTINGISITTGPFIELYLYEVSSFRPTTTASIITETLTQTNVREIANGGGIPFSKVYKDFMYTHRSQAVIANESTSYYGYGTLNKTAMELYMTELINAENKKTVDIAKKMDIKFDDGAHNEGSIRGYCRNGTTSTNSGLMTYNDTNTKVCPEILYYFDVK